VSALERGVRRRWRRAGRARVDVVVSQKEHDEELEGSGSGGGRSRDEQTKLDEQYFSFPPHCTKDSFSLLAAFETSFRVRDR